MNRLRTLAIFAAVAGAALVAGFAAADWVVNSAGNGAAVSGTAASIDVTPGVPTVPLFPGTSGDVAVTLTNNNPFDVTVTNINGNGPVISDDPTCQADGHQVTFTDQSGSWLVASGATVELVLADAASMGTGAAVSCQGVTFTVPLSLAG